MTVATELRDLLGLSRAVETGTFQGEGARQLAAIYPNVVTIEIDEECYRRAGARLADFPGVQRVHGDSAHHLGSYVTDGAPTFYFLDSHWSGGPTSGYEKQCPVLDEIAALRKGHPQDCVVIDDARQFLSAPAPPYEPTQWATFLELIDAIRAVYPAHHVTVLNDQIFAVPFEAKSVIDRYGQRVNRRAGATLLRKALGDHLQPWSPLRVRLHRWNVSVHHRLNMDRT